MKTIRSMKSIYPKVSIFLDIFKQIAMKQKLRIGCATFFLLCLVPFSAHSKSYEFDHWFPQQFEAEFAAVGLYIHDYTLKMEKGSHRLKHSAGYNEEWAEFLKKCDGKCSIIDMFKFARKMAKKYGLKGAKFYNYFTKKPTGETTSLLGIPPEDGGGGGIIKIAKSILNRIKEKMKSAKADKNKSTDSSSILTLSQLQAGGIQAAINGTGETSSVQLVLTNQTANNVTVLIPSGTVLSPSSNVQPLLVR